MLAIAVLAILSFVFTLGGAVSAYHARTRLDGVQALCFLIFGTSCLVGFIVDLVGFL